jgi:diacylglycerol O-acyltransferase
LAFFAGPVPTPEEIRAAVGRKLPLAPRCRQRLVKVPFALGRPVWVDDPEFDLSRHVVRVRVPAPGGHAELVDLVGRLLSEPLDHALPLWQDWVVEGLPDGRWALLTKVHHTMVDGIAGTDLLSTLLDTTPDGEPVPSDDWHPAGVPGPVRLVSEAVRENVGLRLDELRSLPVAVGAALRGGLRHPRTATEGARAAARGLLGFVGNARLTPGTSLIGPIGRDRGFGWTDVDLDAVLEAHRQLGGTVNDLVLAAVTNGFRELLIARGDQPIAQSVRSLVPVSVRRPHERGQLDNRVSAILVELPVEIEDPRDRLTEVAIRMRSLKASHEAQIGEQITGIADALPPLALAAFLHLVFRLPHRNLTTVITNVPGPDGALFLAGRPMLAMYPYVPIADRLRTGIAVTTYDGRLLLGVTTDRSSMPDADLLLKGVDRGFAALTSLADRRTRGTRTKVVR